MTKSNGRLDHSKVESAWQTDTTPKESLGGGANRTFTSRMPDWNQFRGRVEKFSGADDRAEFARQAIEDARSRFSDGSIEEIKKLGQVTGLADAMDGWLSWAGQTPFPSRIESPNGSVWHKLKDAYRAKRILWSNHEKGMRSELKIPASYDVFFAEEPQVIVVEHDWAKAFAGATDFDEGEFPLPYERCLFEFRLAGRRAFVLLHHHQHIVITEIGVGFWMATEATDLSELKRAKRYHAMYDNIRAVAIALDAEVAVTDVVRAPHRLNMSREKQGKLPINDYHVINLAKRSRVEALPSAGEHEAKWHPRLHFRRGHWRHYDNHKTWIRWTLCGDPDLGFIDKEYRA